MGLGLYCLVYDTLRGHMGLLRLLHEERRPAAQRFRVIDQGPRYRKNIWLKIRDNEDLFPGPEAEDVPHGDTGRLVKRGHSAHWSLADLLREFLEDFLPHALDELDGADHEVAAAVHAAAPELVPELPDHLRDVHQDATGPQHRKVR